MKKRVSSDGFLRQALRFLIVLVVCTALVLPASALSLTESPPAAGQDATVIPTEQRDSLVASIALYPDNLLSQVLVASTYPLELMQLYQWLQKNPDLAKDQKKLADAVKKQPWDPSIQAMAVLPDT